MYAQENERGYVCVVVQSMGGGFVKDSERQCTDRAERADPVASEHGEEQERRSRPAAPAPYPPGLPPECQSSHP